MFPAPQLLSANCVGLWPKETALRIF